MIAYEVSIYDTEEHTWNKVAMEMCSINGLLCDVCKKDNSHIDNCDYFHYMTLSFKMAQERKKLLEEQGEVVKIIEVKV